MPTDNKAPFKSYNCGGFGHIAHRCPDSKNKNNEKVNEKLPAESVRGIKGGDDRSMKEHPVYIRVPIGCKDTVCLVDISSKSGHH